MEDNELWIPTDMDLISSERITHIESDKSEVKIKNKNRISPYLVLTLSALFFVLVYTFINFGSDRTKSAEDDSAENRSFSEFLTFSVLSLGYEREPLMPVEKNEPEKDEQAGEALQNKEPSEVVLEQNSKPPIKEQENIEADKKYPIVEMDLSRKHLGEYYIGNETGYTPDVKKLLEDRSKLNKLIYEESNEPLVLIIHTHGTESYMENGTDHYVDTGGDIARTTDTNKNVVHIGRIIKKQLTEEGICTLHCEIMHDKDSYQDSYLRAAETIKEYVSKYPSIKYVFDVHRDAIMSADGSMIKAVAEIDGEKTAQVMTVVGSNYKGANFPDWETHLALSLNLKANLDEKYNGLSRPVYLRGAAYNQQYLPGSLLLEVGTSGNTLEEAERAAELLGKALAETIKNIK